MARADVFRFVADQRSVTPATVTRGYARAWPTDPLTVALESAHRSDEWGAVAEIRNILAHRAGPGRNFHSFGDRHGDGRWLDESLTIATTQAPRNWVVVMSAEIIRAAAPFARTNVPAPI